YVSDRGYRWGRRGRTAVGRAVSEPGYGRGTLLRRPGRVSRAFGHRAAGLDTAGRRVAYLHLPGERSRGLAARRLFRRDRAAALGPGREGPYRHGLGRAAEGRPGTRRDGDPHRP